MAQMAATRRAGGSLVARFLVNAINYKLYHAHWLSGVANERKVLSMLVGVLGSLIAKKS